MLISGNYEHTIDAKNRLAVPADIRARWRPEEQGAAWYSVPWTGNLLRLYPERDFETRAKSGFLSLTPDEDESDLQATLFGMSKRLEVDSAGRIMLPDQHIKLAKLPREVILVGCGDRLEVRDRAGWNESLENRIAQLPELLARISAKKERGRRD